MKRQVNSDATAARDDDDGAYGDLHKKSAELLVATMTASGISLQPTTMGTSATSLRHDDDVDKSKRISKTPVPFGSLTEAFGYLVFLVVFLLATCVLDDREQPFYFANRIKSALVQQPFLAASTLAGQADSGSVQKKFPDIQDQNDVWAFLEGPFMDVLYGTEDNEDSTTTTGMVLSYNRALGGVRLRTLRMKPDSCPVLSQIPEYASIVPYCYGSFTSSNQQRDGYGPIGNSNAIIAALAFAFAQDLFAGGKATSKTYADLQVCYSDCARTCGDHFGVDRFRYVSDCTQQCGIHCKCIYEQPPGFTLCTDPNGGNGALPTAEYAYNWSSATESHALPVHGVTGTSYPGSGYIVDLSSSSSGSSGNGTLARETLMELRQDRYVDLATRALVVDVTLFNAYAQLFNLVQFVVEFPPTGGAFVRFSDDVLHPFRYSSASTARIVLECLLIVYVAMRWKTMLQGMHADGSAWKYLRRSLWHCVTCSFVAVFTALAGLRLYLLDQAYGTLSGHVASEIDTASLDAIPNLQVLARLSYAENVLSSVTAALVWLQFVQYTQMSRRMCLLLRMLRRAAMDLVWFALYFFVCICAFAQVGFLLFGLRVRQFRSLGVAIVTLLQGVAGDLAYDDMADAHRVLGPLFYIAFYLLLLLILLNVFLAILNDAYVQTLAEQEEDEDTDELEGDDGDHNVQSTARRNLEQLRKYPFSKGVVHALRLLLVELKYAIYELHTGRKPNVTKVDPLGIVPHEHNGAASVSSAGTTSSRKWTRRMKHHVDRQLAAHVDDRVRDALVLKDAELASVRATMDKDIAERLEVLVESNRAKTQRMHDMESLLGSIESLCAKLITDTAYLREDDDNDDQRALAASRRKVLSSSGRRTSPASGASSLTRRANGAMPRPQSLSAALRSAHGRMDGNGEEEKRGNKSVGRGSSKRLVRKGTNEDIEEITL
uniref:Polycystin cation channel PKD1/PKD2 domain-containing protein n=1 Tax=Globisporangium ultimum (strain ATCC 200006 / CBS 805.95 / DAOM BR144) TaxID=431595 RepID=K3X1Q1_GLOUD